MENHRNDSIRVTRSMATILICVGAVAMFFFAMIAANIARCVSLIDQVNFLSELNQSHGYALLSLLILLTGCNLWFAYLLFRSGSNNKANQNHTEDNTKTCFCCSEQISYSQRLDGCSDYSGKTIQPAICRGDDYLSISNVIHCLDDDCAGILGSDRKCSDCGKRF